METATLFTDQKWKILSALSEGKFSPLQLAEKSNTSIANISQQLRLLEFTNLVKKEKIPNRDKGKPRTLFSLSEDYAYVISLMKGFSDKKLVKLDNLHKIIFRILSIEDRNLCYYIEKFIWGIEDCIEYINVIILKQEDGLINVIIAAKDMAKIDKKVKNVIIKKPNGESRNFKVKIISMSEMEKLAKQKRGIFAESENAFLIYDTEGIIQKINKRGDMQS